MNDVSIMPTSMTFVPVERMPSMSALDSSGECGRMSRPTTIVSSRFTRAPAATPARERFRYCAVACPTFHAASALSGSG